jgi:hypothetical protein
MVAVSSASVRLHPLVLINITDQVTRRDFAVAVADNGATDSNGAVNMQSQDFVITSAGVLLGTRTVTVTAGEISPSDDTNGGNGMIVENSGMSDGCSQERIQVHNSFELKFGIRTEEEEMAMGGMAVEDSPGDGSNDGTLPFLEEVGSAIGSQSSGSNANTCRPAANPFIGESEGGSSTTVGNSTWRVASQPFDKQFLNQRTDQYREVFPQLQIVGWYVSVVRTGDAARAAAEKSRIARENANMNGSGMNSKEDERSINLEGVERYLEQQPGFQQISNIIKGKAATPNPLLLVFDDRCGSGGSAGKWKWYSYLVRCILYSKSLSDSVNNSYPKMVLAHGYLMIMRIRLI